MDNELDILIEEFSTCATTEGERYRLLGKLIVEHGRLKALISQHEQLQEVLINEG